MQQVHVSSKAVCLVTLIAAGALASACQSSVRRTGPVYVPGAPVESATDMVRQTQGRQDADRRCSWDESEVQVGKSGSDKTKKTNPSCGNYGR